MKLRPKGHPDGINVMERSRKHNMDVIWIMEAGNIPKCEVEYLLTRFRF